MNLDKNSLKFPRCFKIMDKIFLNFPTCFMNLIRFSVNYPRFSIFPYNTPNTPRSVKMISLRYLAIKVSPIANFVETDTVYLTCHHHPLSSVVVECYGWIPTISFRYIAKPISEVTNEYPYRWRSNVRAEWPFSPIAVISITCLEEWSATPWVYNTQRLSCGARFYGPPPCTPWPLVD